MEDAFGSEPHSLINKTLSLEQNFITESIRIYFHNLYMHAQPVTQSKTWKSDPFSFKRGFFQGDQLGPVIFLLVFNPILQYLQNNSHTDYKLGDMS